MASRGGHDKAIELLVKDSRVSPPVQINESIRSASENGHNKALELLIKDKRVRNLY